MIRVAAIAVVIGALPGALAATPDRPAEFEFARTKIGSFQANAETTIDWRGAAPMIGDIKCYGHSPDISFTVDQTGDLKLTFAFLGLPEPNGNRPNITLTGDSLWLFVDGRRYEYRNIPAVAGFFTNYPYPPPPKDAVVLPVWRGHRGIRATTSGPFMNLSLIYGDILRARKIEWAFKSRNWDQVDRSVPENALPADWRTRRYRIDNKGLKAAVEWCVDAVANDKARALPRAIIEAAK